jgi:hypothetical protein
MKRKKKEGFTDFVHREAMAAIEHDINQMSKAEMLEMDLLHYSQLQSLWRKELERPRPSWQFLEEVASEMKIMEETLEPLLRCL